VYSGDSSGSTGSSSSTVLPPPPATSVPSYESSSSAGAFPITVYQLNLTLGLLEALSGPNSDLSFSVPTQRVLGLLLSWLQDEYMLRSVGDQATNDPTFVFQFTTLNVSLLIADCGCDPSQSVLSTIALLSPANDVVGLLGPTCSAGALTSNLIASYYKIPEISYTATAVSLNVPQTFPYFFRVTTDDSYYLAVVVAMCKHYGWNHVGVLATDDSKGISAVLSLQTQASLESFTSGDTTNNLQSQFTALRLSGANIFILWATLSDCRYAIKRAQSYNFLRQTQYSNLGNRNLVWIVPPSCADNYTSDPTFLSALPGVLSFQNDIYDPTYSLYQQLNQAYDDLYNNTSSALSYISYCAFDALLAFAFAASAELAAGVMPSMVTGPGLRAQLLNLSFRGVTGRIQFVESADVNQSFKIVNYQVAQWSPTGVAQVLNTVQVGDATIVAYNTVPIASYQNNSNAAVFISLLTAIPKDEFIVVTPPPPTYNSGSSGGVGDVSTSTFIAIMVSIGGFLLLMVAVWTSLWAWRRRMNRLADELEEARRVATEAKEQAIMSNKAKSQFLANMRSAERFHPPHLPHLPHSSSLHSASPHSLLCPDPLPLLSLSLCPFDVSATRYVLQ
jgi:ABC-type branched-subunit amino acid transport system substrate-binding protein